ncbi:MAG: hypothetical protein NTX45_16765 [Proteobacteria bacterium]|nr:hypothetical protein [Pseudomonadota bacterium]
MVISPLVDFFVFLWFPRSSVGTWVETLLTVNRRAVKVAFPRRIVTAIKLAKYRRSGMDRRNLGSREGAGLGASPQSGYRRSLPV